MSRQNIESRNQVAIFIRTLHDAGGAQRAMARYATGLALRGIPVDVLTLKPGGPFAAELHPDIRTIAIAGGRLNRAVPAIAGYLRKARPRVLFSTEPGCNVIVILAKLLSLTGTRTVIREGLFPSVAMREDPHRSTRTAYRLSRFIYPHADAVVAIATPMADDLAEVAHLKREAVTTIAVNPVVTPRLLEAADLRPMHPWFAEGQPPVVLGVGRLGAQKGFLTLVQAFEKARVRRACRLMIIGEGPERPALEAAIAASAYPEDIQLAGFMVEPYAYMRYCGVFVLSSRFEGLPNVLIEAIACGAPVVSTDCKSGPSDVLDHGKYGSLVPVGDAEAMADAIDAVLANPPSRERQRERGMDFTVEKSLERYLPVLLPDEFAE